MILRGTKRSGNEGNYYRPKPLTTVTMEILNEYTNLGNETIKYLFTSETGYQTPKVDIRASVFNDDKILMVKEKSDGEWSLPGGWADVNTSIRESAVRECFEEAGARVQPYRIVAIHHANKRNNPLFLHTIYKIFVECELIEISFNENTETIETGFFGIDNLPELSFHRNTPEQIKMCFEARRQNPFETIFD